MMDDESGESTDVDKMTSMHRKRRVGENVAWYFAVA